MMIGAMVKHKVFGKGIITNNKDGYITVNFEDVKSEKRFIYPDVFEKFLVFELPKLQEQAYNAFLAKQRQLQAEKLKKQEEQNKGNKKLYGQQIEEKSTNADRKGKKIPPRKNLAFKLNYCDGGVSKDSIGFKGVCSDEIIIYNIKKVKRAWCSFKGCPCRRYFDGLITREELDSVWKTGFICYESVSLTDWVAHAGTDLKGVNAGKARRLPNAQCGSLAILTTRYPNEEEKERVIVGVFVIDATFEGDVFEGGNVSTRSKYKIENRPKEAQKLKFWDYYKNLGNPESIKWGTGLYRYIKDEDALRLLEDIVVVKRGKSDYGLAIDILNHFKKLHALYGY